MRIKKAIFPVAGLGTRFLPATKALPKEMLTVIDKPLIQYAVEEAIEAGITDLIFITSIHKRAIEDHFDKNFELEYNLKKKNQYEILKKVKSILPENINCAYIRQKEALGLGHAILCAKPLIGKEPFAVLLADDLIYNSSGNKVLSQLIESYNKEKCGVLAIQRIPKEDVKSYGIVKMNSKNEINSIIEKPNIQDAPSNHAVVGRYILPHEIFSYIQSTEKGTGGEIQLTDAISKLLKQHKLVGHFFDGIRYDCGNKLGFLMANFELAIQDPMLGEGFMKMVQKSING